MRLGAVVVGTVGLGFLLVGYFGSRARGQATVPAALRRPLVRVEYVPHPRDIVNLTQGSTYIVPAGKVLVLRDFAISDVPAMPSVGDHPTGFSVTVNGVTVWKSGGGVYYQENTSSFGFGYAAIGMKGNDVPLGPLSVGVVAHAGDAVAIASVVGSVYASGFLAEQ